MDDPVCLCFRVPMRKIVNYCRREQPKYASQISRVLPAGTGCGWCIPFLEEIHRQVVIEGREQPDLAMTPEEYAERRQQYRESIGNPATKSTQ